LNTVCKVVRISRTEIVSRSLQGHPLTWNPFQVGEDPN
jgi:hypothetical protein